MASFSVFPLNRRSPCRCERYMFTNVPAARQIAPKVRNAKTTYHTYTHPIIMSAEELKKISDTLSFTFEFHFISANRVCSHSNTPRMLRLCVRCVPGDCDTIGVRYVFKYGPIWFSKVHFFVSARLPCPPISAIPFFFLPPSLVCRFDELHRLPFDSVIENSAFGSKTWTARVSFCLCLLCCLSGCLINIHSRNAFLSSHKFSVVFHMMEASRLRSFPAWAAMERWTRQEGSFIHHHLILGDGFGFFCYSLSLLSFTRSAADASGCVGIWGKSIEYARKLLCWSEYPV